jgi:predicted DNA-binding protein (MmcQ/YjbR family)
LFLFLSSVQGGGDMLNEHDLIQHCLSQTGAVEEFPFGPDARVYKVMNKMFALIPVGEPVRISLKCDPTLARILRDTYPAVQPGYHLNKRHWNTVLVDGTISDQEVREMIDNSYDLVVGKLSRKERETLAGMGK